MTNLIRVPKAVIPICSRQPLDVVLQLFFLPRAVTDPRDGRRVALKKLPNVFQSLVSSKRVFRELKMLCFFKHENVSYLPFLIYGPLKPVS